MTRHEKPEPHPKDRVPPEEGVIHPTEELDRLNDHTPSEGLDPNVPDAPRPAPKRPTDGPL